MFQQTDSGLFREGIFVLEYLWMQECFSQPIIYASPYASMQLVVNENLDLPLETGRLHWESSNPKDENRSSLALDPIPNIMELKSLAIELHELGMVEAHI